MKQKLAVARALLHDPEVILLDEPTANLDPQTSRAVRELIAELRDRGRAIIVSSHNLDEVERMATRIALISTRLIAVGEPAALRQSLFGRRLRITFAGASPPPAGLAAIAARCGARDVGVEADVLTMTLTDPDREVPPLVAALVGAGAAVRGVQDEEQPLEEVYIRLLSRSGPAA
jgi:ABC-2 type transport system ATP-binding protein